MRNTVVIVLVTLAVAVHGYNRVPDNLDIESVVGNEKVLQSFLYCFNDKGPCDEITQNLKEKLPSVLQEACARCSPTHKRKLKMFLNSSSAKLPEDYAEFKKKHDPEGTLFPALEAALEYD